MCPSVDKDKPEKSHTHALSHTHTIDIDLLLIMNAVLSVTFGKKTNSQVHCIILSYKYQEVTYIQSNYNIAKLSVFICRYFPQTSNP